MGLAESREAAEAALDAGLEKVGAGWRRIIRRFLNFICLILFIFMIYLAATIHMAQIEIDHTLQEISNSQPWIQSLPFGLQDWFMWILETLMRWGAVMFVFLLTIKFWLMRPRK